MKVLRLKIEQKVAGSKFPFDFVYLVKNSDRDAIKRLFNYSIAMPVVGEMREMLEKVTLRKLAVATQHRDLGSTPVPTAQADIKNYINFNEQWLCVVPLLPRKQKPGTPSTPRYLTAKGWMFKGNAIPIGRDDISKATERVKDGSGGTRESPFGQQAYLQIPGKTIRPPCLLCPRMMLHQTGDCRLGDAICYTELPLGLSGISGNTRSEPDSELEDHEAY